MGKKTQNTQRDYEALGLVGATAAHAAITRARYLVDKIGYDRDDVSPMVSEVVAHTETADAIVAGAAAAGIGGVEEWVREAVEAGRDGREVLARNAGLSFDRAVMAAMRAAIEAAIVRCEAFDARRHDLWEALCVAEIRARRVANRLRVAG